MPARKIDPEVKFANSTEWQGACLIWTAGRSPLGYGRIRVNGRVARAHRYAWERVNGPIPEGMLIDHTCHNPPCVNVAHLRLATLAENMRNRNGAHRTNRLGVRGVVYDRGRYRARYWFGGEQVHVGTYATLDEAARAVEVARTAAFGEFSGNTRRTNVF